MPTYISNTQADYVLANNEDLVLLGTGNLTSQAGAALSSAFSNNTIKIAGTLAGVMGMNLQGPDAQTTKVVLSATASVFAVNSGMVFGAGFVQLQNAGSIQSELYGIAVNGNGSATNQSVRITNTGLISGLDAIVVEQSVSNTYADVSLVNRGDILASREDNYAFVSEHVNGIDSIVNHGNIEGIISTGSMNDTVINRGYISGEIQTGEGADTVNNLRSKDFRNQIYLGAGDDTIYAGQAEDVIFGGTGVDTVSYRDTNGVRIDLLDFTRSTNEAKRDFYDSVEKFIGSEFYADTMIGDAGANQFFGRGGNDTLSGGEGADTLMGGNGLDRLTGGLGNDTFKFHTQDSNHDVIADFGAVSGNNDRFHIIAAFLGLPNGAISSTNFRARTDNVAQDGNDHFIFRTGDKTLWFDADGNGAVGPVLMADLQASATVTWQDIVLVSA